MLYNIPKIIPPELMKCMMEMGHGDQMILVDANYPSAANAQRLIRTPGVEITDMLEAVLQFLPIDDIVPKAFALMMHGENEPQPEIWDDFRKIIERKCNFTGFKMLGRHEFYEQSRKAYVIVQTGTTTRYANVILQKGVI